MDKKYGKIKTSTGEVTSNDEILKLQKENQEIKKANEILKKEEVNVNTYTTFKEAKLAIFEFIESWYNNTRIHSTLDYKTPNQKYDEYIKTIA